MRDLPPIGATITDDPVASNIPTWIWVWIIIGLIVLFAVRLLVQKCAHGLQPFGTRISSAGLPSSSGNLGHKRLPSDDCLRFEHEVLRLVNVNREAYGIPAVSLCAPLLAESRQVCSRAVIRWRWQRNAFVKRVTNRGNFEAAAEIVSFTKSDSPANIVSRWMAVRRLRNCVLSPNLELGAVGLVLDEASRYRCITLMMARLTT